MLEDKQERIKAEAYRRWEEEGRPEGQHDRHWQEATEALESGVASDIIESEGATQVLKTPKAKAAKPKTPVAQPKAKAEAAKPAAAAPKRSSAKKAVAE